MEKLTFINLLVNNVKADQLLCHYSQWIANSNTVASKSAQGLIIIIIIIVIRSIACVVFWFSSLMPLRQINVIFTIARFFD